MYDTFKKYEEGKEFKLPGMRGEPQRKIKKLQQ